MEANKERYQKFMKLNREFFSNERVVTHEKMSLICTLLVAEATLAGIPNDILDTMFDDVKVKYKDVRKLIDEHTTNTSS